jgi:hypothetical protein
MKEGDSVLIVTHHFPFAWVTVAGPYNYIRSVAPEIGVWFRHFRSVLAMIAVKRAIILLRFDWLTGLIGALLW